jgi:hypothetical protein
VSSQKLKSKKFGKMENFEKSTQDWTLLSVINRLGRNCGKGIMEKHFVRAEKIITG